MSMDVSSASKRTLSSSFEREIAVTKRPCEDAGRGYGDTYATGNAYVHNGDNINLYQDTTSLQNEVQQL